MQATFDPQPITLEGAHVRLEPLTLEHAPDLTEAARAEAIWLYMPIAPPLTLSAMERCIVNALETAAGGREVPFATIHKESGRAVGSTRYLDISRANRNLEIGWTWLGTAAQRTPVNTECKYLLLSHAFEAHGAMRVFFKTDGRNERSQKAIARIGAKYEGTFRRNRVLHDGYVRDSVYFSILDDEWPAVKRDLEQKLARARV